MLYLMVRQVLLRQSSLRSLLVLALEPLKADEVHPTPTEQSCLLAIITVYPMPQAPVLSLAWPGLASQLDSIARRSPRSNCFSFTAWFEHGCAVPHAVNSGFYPSSTRRTAWRRSGKEPQTGLPLGV